MISRAPDGERSRPGVWRRRGTAHAPLAPMQAGAGRSVRGVSRSHRRNRRMRARRRSSSAQARRRPRRSPGVADYRRKIAMLTASFAIALFQLQPERRASAAITPRPIVSIAATMRPSRPSSRSASATMRIFGVAVGEARRRARAILTLIAMRIERADARKGARGRAADAGVAMHDQRRAAIPAAHEFRQIGDVLLVRHDVAVERRADVVQPQPEMIFRRDTALGRSMRTSSPSSDTTCRAPVSSTVSCSSASGADVNHRIRCFICELDIGMSRHIV